MAENESRVAIGVDTSVDADHEDHLNDLSAIHLPGKHENDGFEYIKHIVKDSVKEYGKNTVLELLGIRRYNQTIRLIRPALTAFGLLIRFSFIILFVLGFVFYFRESRRSPFISVLESAGICTAVEKAVTVRAIGDKYGYWEGSVEYAPHFEIYKFDMFDYLADSDSNYEFMMKAYDTFERVNDITEVNNLGVNYIYWATFLYKPATIGSYGNDVDHHIYYAADAKYILNTEKISGTISSVDFDCPLSVTTQSYDKSNGNLITTISYTTLSSNTRCNSTITPSEFGYDGDDTGDIFTVKLNGNALFNAIGFGYKSSFEISLTDTFPTIAVYTTGVYQGVSYTVLQKADEIRPHSEIMYCVGPTANVETSEDFNCVVRIGNTFGVPYHVHFGKNESFPEQCTCDSGPLPDICHKKKLLAGILYWDITSNPAITSQHDEYFQPFLPLIEYFQDHTVNSTQTDVYEPAWIAYQSLKLSSPSPLFNDSTYRQSLYDFSNTASYGYGSLLVYYLSSDYEYEVSYNRYAVRNGSCSELAYASSNFSKLIEVPYTSLEENYYNCYMNTRSAVANAIGISQGIVNFTIPILFMIIIDLILGAHLLHVCFSRNKSDGSMRTNSEFTIHMSESTSKREMSESSSKQDMSESSRNIVELRRLSSPDMHKSWESESGDSIHSEHSHVRSTWKSNDDTPSAKKRSSSFTVRVRTPEVVDENSFVTAKQLEERLSISEAESFEKVDLVLFQIYKILNTFDYLWGFRKIWPKKE